MRYTTIEFAGLQLDTFLGDSGTAYVTLTSIAKGLDISRQSAKDWTKNHCTHKGTPVQVGKTRVHATAYPVDVIGDFINYRVTQGDKQALALYSATFRADLERSIKEANGILVTAAQHEEVRTNKRLEYLQQWRKDNYQPTILKNGVIEPLGLTACREAGFTSTEAQIVELEAHIARRELLMTRPDWAANPDAVAEEQRGIERYRKDIQRLAVSLTN